MFDLVPELIERLAPTSPDLAALGAESEGVLTVAGIVALASGSHDIPPWAGFLVRSWPGALVDRPRLAGPEEVRRLALPTLSSLEVIATEIAVRLGEQLPTARFDGILETSRELLANAVAHRDYGVSAPIQVDMFADAVCISSPGEPQHAEVVDGGFRGRGARDPILHHLLRRLGVARQQGLGWPRSQRLMKEAGLALEVAVGGGHTVVSIMVDPIPRGVIEDTPPEVDSRLRIPGGVWEERVMRLLADGALWRPADIESALGIPRSTLTTVMRRLAARGVVEAERSAPRSSRQRWRRAQ